MNSTVSALLTVLVLLAGFSAASLAYVSVYSVKAAELRESRLEADAATELLHAYVYRDVNTNASLLTLRNAGKTALEITDLLLADRTGNVVKVVRLNETIKLSPQQYKTMPFAALAGPEYGNYTETFDRLSAAYFKTFRGRVFGSRYLAPPVVEVAAYETSYTTQTTQLTSTDRPTVIETTVTLTTSSVTVIIDNPSVWPVHVYPGIAYPRGDYRRDVSFPSWGLLPGLQAKYWDNRIRNVTSASDIKIPFHVSCWTPFEGWSDSWTFIGRWRPAPVSALGPTFTPLDIVYVQNYATCSNELFFPENVIVNMGIGDYYYDTYSDTVSTGNLTGTGTINMTFPEDRYPVTVRKVSITVYSDTCWNNRRRSDGRCVLYVFNDGITSPVNLKINTQRSRNVDGAAAGVNIVLENQAPLTVSYYTLQNNTMTISVTYEYKVARNYVDIEFPTSIDWYRVALEHPSVYIRDIHKLAYVAVVDLWNTTNVIAYSTGDPIRVYGDRPLGVVAVYTYDRTVEHVPRPPPPPEPTPCLQGYGVAVCFSDDAIEAGGGSYYGASTSVPCGSPPPSLSPTINLPNSGCDAYIAPGPGTYDPDQLPKCSKQGAQATCSDVPYGTTVVVDCDQYN